MDGILRTFLVQGPFVKMNELISLLENEKLGSTFEGMPVGNDTGASSTGGGEKVGQKRKHEGEMDGGPFLGVPPANDIYRSRQQKRVHVT